jgi:hypothetical protein
MTRSDLEHAAGCTCCDDDPLCCEGCGNTVEAHECEMLPAAIAGPYAGHMLCETCRGELICQHLEDRRRAHLAAERAGWGAAARRGERVAEWLICLLAIAAGGVGLGWLVAEVVR